MNTYDLINPEWRERFCGDFKIPIKIFTSPLFEYYCNLLEKDYEINKKAELFINSLKSFDNDLKKFMDEWHRIKHDLIQSIKDTPEYQKEISTDFTYRTPFKVERGNPYNQAFKDVECISIDIISANFQSLKFMSPKIVLDTNSFKELVSKFTPDPYFGEVKIFRQIVFEALGANRQQSTQRKMMDKVLTSLFQHKPDLYVRMPSNDEIIVPLNQGSSSLGDEVEEIIKNHELGSILKVERFTVKHIEDDMFYKLFKDGKVILRNVSGHHFSRAYKLTHNLPLSSEDDFFVFEGRLARFVRD